MSAPELSLPVPRAAETSAVLAALAEAAVGGQPAVLATVVARRGSAPATPGQKLVLVARGPCLGTVGGGALEREVLTAMVTLLEECERGADPAGPRVVHFDLGAGLGMCCGGGVDVMLETFAPAAVVLLVGAGHVAQATAPLLRSLGFEVTVCDEREAFADDARFAGARVVSGSFRDAGRGVPRGAAVLVMTHDHALDQDALEWALREGFAFVGGVGSRAKIARSRARMEARGFGPTEIARVRMPIGVAIGARSPAEIAVAIAAEMVAWRRGIALEAGERGAIARPAGSGRAVRVAREGVA